MLMPGFSRIRPGGHPRRYCPNTGLSRDVCLWPVPTPHADALIGTACASHKRWLITVRSDRFAANEDALLVPGVQKSACSNEGR
jgi:hypothetical protein